MISNVRECRRDTGMRRIQGRNLPDREYAWIQPPVRVDRAVETSGRADWCAGATVPGRRSLHIRIGPILSHLIALIRKDDPAAALSNPTDLAHEIAETVSVQLVPGRTPIEPVRLRADRVDRQRQPLTLAKLDQPRQIPGALSSHDGVDLHRHAPYSRTLDCAERLFMLPGTSIRIMSSADSIQADGQHLEPPDEALALRHQRSVCRECAGDRVSARVGHYFIEIRPHQRLAAEKQHSTRAECMELVNDPLPIRCRELRARKLGQRAVRASEIASIRDDGRHLKRQRSPRCLRRQKTAGCPERVRWIQHLLSRGSSMRVEHNSSRSQMESWNNGMVECRAPETERRRLSQLRLISQFAPRSLYAE